MSLVDMNEFSSMEKNVQLGGTLNPGCNLISHFSTTIRNKCEERPENIPMELLNSMKKKTNVAKSPEKLYAEAEIFLSRKEYWDACELYRRSIQKLMEEVDLKFFNVCVYLCIPRLIQAAQQAILFRQASNTEKFKLEILALVREVQAQIPLVPEVSDELLIVAQADCSLQIATFYIGIQEHARGFEACKEGLEIIEFKLPYSKEKHKTYGFLLERLGQLCFPTMHLSEVKKCLEVQLTAFQMAEDFESAEGKESAISRTNEALSRLKQT